MSLWDAFKLPEEEDERHKSLMAHFTELPRGATMLGAAGKIRSGPDAQRALEAGLDFVLIGRAAILHHDFPLRVRADAAFEPVATPVSAAYLRGEGLGPAFVSYMRTWKGFVEEEAA
jgi:2,4-dienoyl-CoA reductase-like NADH-dependent reductase (Old Yellow Enzyme family)